MAIVNPGPLHTYINLPDPSDIKQGQPHASVSLHFHPPAPALPQSQSAMATIVSGNPIINSTQTLVDDRNPLISYTGGPWELGGTPGFEYNGTTHGVLNPATVRLSFQGTYVALKVSTSASSPKAYPD
jgi:hypothetical protein